MSGTELRICAAEKAQENVKTTKRDLALIRVRSAISGLQKQLAMATKISTSPDAPAALRTRMARKGSRLVIQLSREERLQSRLSVRHVPESDEAAFAVLTEFVGYPYLCGLPSYFLETLVSLVTEAQKFVEPDENAKQLAELSGKPVPPANEIKALLNDEIDSFDRAHAIVRHAIPDRDNSEDSGDASASKKRKQ